MNAQIVLAATSLTAIAIVAFAMLRGWQGWLSLKEHELERGPVAVVGLEVADHPRRPQQHLVQGEEDRQLQHQRQAAAQLADPVLLVESLLLLEYLLVVALVLAPDLAHQRLHALHLFL